MNTYTFTLDATAVVVGYGLAVLTIIVWMGILHHKCRAARKDYKKAKKEAMEGRERLDAAIAKTTEIEERLNDAVAIMDYLPDVKLIKSSIRDRDSEREASSRANRNNERQGGQSS
ncbi:hypothetical protein OH491_17545 [Termitidicoccus mucosus]|uniref:Uncharacterized protein n=1 Tax=Termitidicoccus mucosus TaxID=1184151 RepID=A0A178IIW9_9BACT|nr:hypothetical protein AW736_11055 [Opitutaceae bacterium TSB47]